MKKFIKVASLLFLASLLFGCSKTVVVTDDVLDPTDIVLNEKEKTLTLGETYQIRASYLIDGRNENVNFSYKSLNTSVATVSSSGLVEAVGVGEAIIQITYEKSKSLLKIIVKEGQEASLLGLIIHNDLISLYEGDQYEFKYDVRLNGNPIDLEATYSNYDSSIIEIENNIIIAKGVGTTEAKIKVTYGEIFKEESFTVSVMETRYYLSCNYENNQVVAGEENLKITYSLNYGRNSVKSLSLNELITEVSDTDIAGISGDYIFGIKKGYFDLTVSYQVLETGETLTSTDTFRCREKYSISSEDFAEVVYVLDGEKIDYIPESSNPDLIFDAWLKDGDVFDEPVESDLVLAVRWKVAHDYLPHFRDGSFTGAIFSTDDPNAHYDSENKKPTVVPFISEDDGSEDYLYYYQDRTYDEEQGWTHCNANYTLALPAIDFTKQVTGYKVMMPFEIEGGFYIGFTEDEIVTDCKGQLRFEYIVDSGLSISICTEIGETIYSYLYTDSEVINGNIGFTFPVCYSTHCFQRGLMLYQPRFIGKCEKHHYNNTLLTDRIGYFGTVCSVCGEAGPASEEKMYLNDINFTVAQYGAQGGRWGTNVLPTEKTMTFEVTEGGVENMIHLPKINFSIYNTVSFNLSGNVWDARVGLQTGSYAFPYNASKIHSGTLTFITHGNEVNVSLICPDGSNQYLTITDLDVINGIKSFPLYIVSDDAYRRIIVELTVLQDSCAHNYTISSDKIGAEVCSICGDQRNYKTNISDIDFTVAQYGAQGGRWETNVQPTEKTMMFEVTEGDTENTISLPKINFKAFSSVQFNVTCGSFAIGTGLKSGEYVLPGSNNNADPAHSGVLSFVMNGEQLEATLTCNETMQSQTIIITDEKVINGDASASLFMYSIVYKWQTITIELVTLN